MISTSSRILRADELDQVAPVQWQEAQETSVLSEPAAPEPDSSLLSAQIPEADLNPDPERVEREAYQRGFAEGKAVARETAMTEVQVVLDRLTRSLAELSALRGRIRKDAEGDLVKLALAVARRVLHRELTLDPESISGLVRVAIEKLDARELSRVRVHPDQEDAVRGALVRFSGIQNVEIIADPSLQRGDVLFETPHGTLDASIEVQLQEIERGFADRMKR